MTSTTYEYPIDHESTHLLRLRSSADGWFMELVASRQGKRFALGRALRRHLRVMAPDPLRFPADTDLIVLPRHGRVEVLLGERRLLALNLGDCPTVASSPYRLAPFETRFLGDNGHPHPIGPLGSGGVRLSTDLHTHLAGCVRPLDLIEIGIACDVAYPAKLLEEAGIRAESPAPIPLSTLSVDLRSALAAQLALRLDRQVPFSDMEKVYRLRAPITKHPAAFVPLLRRIAEDYGRMGVAWVELSYFGILEGDRLEVAHRELPGIKRETGVDIRFLAALNRHDDLEWDLDLLDRIDQLAESPYLAGVDFMGQETNSTHDFAHQLRALAEWADQRCPGFIVRVHAGENPAYPENVRVAVETVAGCDVRLRIGHGLYGSDDATLELLRDTDTIVEFNLNSNLTLNNLESAAEIPLSRYLDAGVPCVLCTDGYAIYGTSPELEVQAARLAGLTDQGLALIRTTEQRYIQERWRHESEHRAMTDNYRVPPPPPARHYTDDVRVRRNAAADLRDRVLMERLAELSVPLLTREDANALVGGRHVISIAGAWRKSWDAFSDMNQDRVRRLLADLVYGFDSETVIVAGGTASGVEGIVQNAARQRGLTVLGTLVHETPPEGLAPGLLTHAMLVAEKLHDKASGLYPFLKQHGGTCLFIGGGHIVADEIQAAANLRLPYLVLGGVEGASGLHALSVPERAFATAAEALDRVRSRLPWPSVCDPYWHTGMNPVVDFVVVRDDPASGRTQVLLVRRDDDAASEPSAWALPGGFQQTDAPRGTQWTPGLETAEEAAIRELREETGLDVSVIVNRIVAVGEFEGNGRDPRDTPEAWSRSRAFALHLPASFATAPVAGGDDTTDARWIPIETVPHLAFDHAHILERGIATLGTRSG